MQWWENLFNISVDVAKHEEEKIMIDESKRIWVHFLLVFYCFETCSNLHIEPYLEDYFWLKVESIKNKTVFFYFLFLIFIFLKRLHDVINTNNENKERWLKALSWYYSLYRVWTELLLRAFKV